MGEGSLLGGQGLGREGRRANQLIGVWWGVSSGKLFIMELRSGVHIGGLGLGMPFSQNMVTRHK